MSDSILCFVCNERIEDEDELVIASGGSANEPEYQVPCHRDCLSHE